MPLDPEAKAYLDRVAELGLPPAETVSPEENRRGRARLLALRQELARPDALESVARIEDRRIPVEGGSVAARVYRPVGDGPFPILVYFFGGGFIMGEIEAVDWVCRMLANRAGCVVVSCEYRLAPEHKFPGPVMDGYAAVRWAAAHAESVDGDPARLAVGGESAGANIATVACLLARDQGGPIIRFQALIYPPVDFTAGRTADQSVGSQQTLTDARMAYYDGHYFQTADDARNPLASPMLADDLSGLPAAIVVAAELDPLAREDEAYAERLQRSGVSVTYTCYPGMMHGFFSLPGILTQSRRAVEQVAGELRAVFAAG